MSVYNCYYDYTYFYVTQVLFILFKYQIITIEYVLYNNYKS